MPSARWKRNQIENAKAWILKHHTATIAETMQATGISQGSVTRLRKELITAGLLQKFAHTPANQPVVETPARVRLEPLETRELVDAAEAERLLAGIVPDLTREERRKKLEALIRHGGPDHMIRANAEIERMDRRDADGEEIGPVPPQTLDEGIDEVSDMVEALMAWGGEDAVKKAVTRGMERHITAQKEAAKVRLHAAPDLSGIEA